MAPARGRVLDEAVDDPVLHGVHDEREDEHDEGDLDGFIAFCPAERPVADPGDPGQELEEDEDAEFHAYETEEIDDALLQPPRGARRVTVVAGADGFGWSGHGGEEKTAVEELEKEDKDGYADGSLSRT